MFFGIWHCQSCPAFSHLGTSSSIINVRSQKQLPHCPHTDVHSAPLSDNCVNNMNFMRWHCLRQSCWFSVVKRTYTRMYCVKVIFLCWYSTPPTLSSPPPQALVWPGEPAWSAGWDIQKKAGGSGRPAQTGAPPGGAQHRVYAAHLWAGGGASQGQCCPQSAGHLQETG